MADKLERDIKADIRIEASKRNIRLSNNVVGRFLSLDGKRPVTVGLGTGSPDLVGDCSVVITPEWVGRRVAIAAFCENKTRTGTEREMQIKFAAMAKKRGAIHFIGRSVDDIPDITPEYFPMEKE